MPCAAQQAHVDGGAQRHQALVGADVRRRLLAADVLLARLQREHEAAPAVRGPRSRPRGARACAAPATAGRRRSPAAGPPKTRRIAERLPLAHHEVGARPPSRRPGGSSSASAIGSHTAIASAPGAVRELMQRVRALEQAEEVRVLVDQRTRRRRRARAATSSGGALSAAVARRTSARGRRDRCAAPRGSAGAARPPPPRASGRSGGAPAARPRPWRWRRRTSRRSRRPCR